MSTIDYLDTMAATKKILRAWNDRLFAIENNKDKIIVIRTRLTKTTGAIGSTPVSGGTSTKEEQWVNGLYSIEQLENEMRDAEETELELKRCWDRLTQEEQMLLRELYVDNEDRRGIKRIMERLFVEQSEAYRKANMALRRLASLLFW